MELTPQELQIWLEWAGARLWAMPIGRIKPAEPRALWPDYSLESFQVLDFRKAAPPKAAAPSSREIPIIDEILLLPNVCAREETRRVIHARLLVHPINGRYRHNWTEVAKLVKSDRRIVKIWYKRGLEEIIQKANPEKVCLIAAFFAAAESAYAARLAREA